MEKHIKKAKLISILILIILNNTIYSQNKIDSLDYYKNNKNFDKAIVYALKVKSQFEIDNKNNTLDYSNLLINIGKIYSQQLKNADSEKYFINGISILKDIVGENNLDYATKLYEFSFIYSFSGGFQYKAEPLILKSLEIRKKILGENHPDYIKSLEQIGNYYYYWGNNYGKAENYLIEAIEKNKKLYGDDSEKLLFLLSDLAFIYQKQNKLPQSEKLWLELISIKRKQKFNRNFDIFPLNFDDELQKLINFYLSSNNFPEAEKYVLEAIEYRLLNSGKDWKYYSLLEISGDIYMKTGRYFTAQQTYLNVVKFQKHKRLLGINKLANAYFCQGNIRKATKEYRYSSKKFRVELLNDLKVFPKIFSMNSFIIDSFFQVNYHLSFLNILSKNEKRINIYCLENDLILKNLSLHNQQRIFRNIKNCGNVTIKNRLNKVVLDRNKITNIKEIAKEKRPSNYWIFKEETEELEEELALKSITFSGVKNSLSLRWRQIRKKIKKNEVVVDLIAYNYFNKKWTDSTIYAAFVIGKKYKEPKYIPLFEKKQLELIFQKTTNQKVNFQLKKINKQYTDKSIFDLYIKPLEKELEGITTIFLSPSGLGHQIDFAALPINDTQTLGEKYKLHILSSPAELIDYKEPVLDKKSNIELLLYGGIDYDKSNSIQIKLINDNSISSIEDFISSAKRSGIEYLPGTLIEVDGINANKSGYNSRVFKESEATEESIKALDGRTTPYVLHLATHGFFFPDPIQEQPKENSNLEGKSKIYKASEDPMMRSGLLLAGAKNYWGKSNQNNSIEDGILTASEISNLDLSACQLVVLSACETGLGEVKGSEGVFGLQRAFKMAGVKNIIMSLWKVPDAQTAELFDVFYTECFTGKSIHEAFRSAQAKMKAKYSPYYWAGFVLLE